MKIVDIEASKYVIHVDGAVTYVDSIARYVASTSSYLGSTAAIKCGRYVQMHQMSWLTSSNSEKITISCKKIFATLLKDRA